MSKIHELIYNSDTGHTLSYFQREMMESRMKEYAEYYAEKCIEELFGGKCHIISDKIEYTNSENTLKLITNLPPHE